MPLLLALAVIAADPIADLAADVNAVRLLNGLPPVEVDARLSAAASLQSEWLSVARRFGGSLSDHHVLTEWAWGTHPELYWESLLATYGGLIPEWLGSFDLARLCGYGAACRDIVHWGGRNSDPVAAWENSPTHRTTLLWDQAVSVGLDVRRGRAGNFITVAIFGVD